MRNNCVWGYYKGPRSHHVVRSTGRPRRISTRSYAIKLHGAHDWPRPECYTFLCTSQHTRTVHRIQGWYTECKYHIINNYDTKDKNKAYIATLYWARSKWHSMDTCPTLQHTQRKQQRLSTDQNQIGLRVLFGSCLYPDCCCFRCVWCNVGHVSIECHLDLAQ